MTTLLWPGKEFRISHQEMIKGMRVGGTGSALSYLDTLVIPIIENTPDEEDLREGMEEVCESRLLSRRKMRQRELPARGGFLLRIKVRPKLTLSRSYTGYAQLPRRGELDARQGLMQLRADPLASRQPAILVRRHGTYSWGPGASSRAMFSVLPRRRAIPLCLVTLAD